MFTNKSLTLVTSKLVQIFVFMTTFSEIINFLNKGFIGKTRYTLEDDPVCGLTTGGDENCEWDCGVDVYAVPYFDSPDCLLDCFKDNHCGKKAIQEYIDAGGVCGGSSSYDLFFNYGNISPNVQCQYQTIDVNGNMLTFTTVGIFSAETLSLLNEDECILDVYKKSPKLSYTFAYLVYTSSDLKTFIKWTYFYQRYIRGLSENDIQAILPQLPEQPRLQPGLRYVEVDTDILSGSKRSPRNANVLSVSVRPGQSSLTLLPSF